MSGVRVPSPALDDSHAVPLTATWTHEPAADYHKSVGFSCSMLRDYRESPLGFYLRHVTRESPSKSSPAMRRGSLLHLLAEFWPEPIDNHIAVAPDSLVTATGQLSKSASGWLAEIGDKLPTTAEELTSVKEQFAGVLRNPAAIALLDNSIDREFVLRWSWEGFPMRCRCDGATPDRIYDLKTTSEFRPLATFESSVRKFGYDLQSAIYSAGWQAAGMTPEPLAFIVTSNLFPHHCHVVTLPPSVVQRAHERALRYLHEIAQRIEWGDWLPDDYGSITELRMNFYRGDE